MAEFTCPDCPMCGQPPQILLTDQAFCGTDDCRVFMWIPSRTQAENLADAIDMPPLIDLPVDILEAGLDQVEDRRGNA